MKKVNLKSLRRSGKALAVLACSCGVLIALAVSQGAAARPASAHAAGLRQISERGLPSKHKQIAALDVELRTLKQHYQLEAGSTLGSPDIDDYNIAPLWWHGIDGAGITVALLEGWNDPGVREAVTSFDLYNHIPEPPKISTIYPDGRLPRHCPAAMVALGQYGSCQAWQEELDVDVYSVHLIAPYARILLVVTPPEVRAGSDAAEVVAPPEMMKAVEYVSRRHLANVISVSTGSGESTYSHGKPEILAQDPGELAAAAAGIPLLGDTGDCGVVQNRASAHGQCQSVTNSPSIATWVDSPWVTALGGSIPNLAYRAPIRKGPDFLWHQAPHDAEASSSAGLSTIYKRPTYQNDVASITHSAMRSVPDITMDGTDGTSEASPLFAGILALATQWNHGHDLGPINPALYALGPHGARAGIADVVGGNDSADTPAGKVRVPGYVARKGFDIASGWGTVNAARFIPSLVTETRQLRGEASARSLAHTQLTALETTSLHVLPAPGPTTATGRHIMIRATGLLPEDPVTVTVAGQDIEHLRATPKGTLSTVIADQPADRHPGTYRVIVQDMLITETASFRVR